MERVLTLDLDGRPVAYPLSDLAGEEPRVFRDRIGEVELVIFFTPGTASALDRASIAQGRDIGATGVFLPALDGEPLAFEVRDGEIVDERTGSRWNVLGQAVAGPLEGRGLEQVQSLMTFWFSWAAFQPETDIRRL